MADEDISRAELRYRELFEEAPISLWEEDFSGVKAYLERLRDEGVSDLREYFLKHPEAFSECARLIKVLDVNGYTLELYGTSNKQEFQDNLGRLINEETLPSLMEHLLALADGKQTLEGEMVSRTLQGERLDIYLKWIVMPDSQPAYSRVLVTMVDISDRKRAEEKLKESERLYRMLADNAQDLICLCGADFVRRYVSPSYRTVLGYEPEELLGESLFSQVPPGEEEAKKEEFIATARDGFSDTVRQPIRHKEGHPVWVDSKATLLRGEAGERIGWLIVSRDVSEKVEAEEKLRESERLYRMLADNTQDLVCLVDPQGIRLYASPSHKNVLGYEPEELLGSHLLSVVHPDELERVSRELAEGMGRREPGGSRHRLRHKDGHYLWADSHGTPILDEAGEFVGGLAVSWNITEQVEAEEVLKRERRQIISIFESINQVVYVSDPVTYEVLYVNQAMKDAFGKELIGGLCYREFQGFEEPCDFCTNGIILINHGEPYIWEYHNPLTERDYLIVDRIIAWPPDERDARFELAIDITDRKQTEKALQEYNEQLKNFLAVAAHELRHPICLVQGYANTLVDFRQDMPEEMLNEVFDSIVVASGRLTNLVEELMEVSRIEKERFVVDRRATDPERILRQVMEEMRGRGVDNAFEVKTAEGVGTWSLDQDKFHQLMVILLDNAVNYSPPGSPVEVEMEKTVEGLSISVLDRGRGVSAAERDKIFQRFYQVEDIRHHSVPGLGLGLYIAREIVEGHGGRIWHEERPGAGSVFRVILP